MEDTPFIIAENPYFKTLPGYVQETMMQCGNEIDSEDALRSTAEALLGGTANPEL